jgi:hypothetical protein
MIKKSGWQTYKQTSIGKQILLVYVNAKYSQIGVFSSNS